MRIEEFLVLVDGEDESTILHECQVVNAESTAYCSLVVNICPIGNIDVGVVQCYRIGTARHLVPSFACTSHASG